MNADPTRLETGLMVDDVPVVRLENARLRVEVSPDTGGRLTRLVNKALACDFLWRNPGLRLARVPPGAPYDPHFYGGVDEVLPGDLPETIDGLACPDHGELWNRPLAHRVDGDALELESYLPVWGLHYRKRVSLRPGTAWLDLDYAIENHAPAPRRFLWKLHAAAAIDPGDEIVCPAAWAVAADPQWSRWAAPGPHPWPLVGGQPAGRVPPPDGTTDFYFLYGLRAGQLALRRAALGGELAFAFDPAVFPYVCVFASYGGFDGHYTAVLEPASAMPLAVNAAAALGQCTVLAPGARLTTRVSIYAGPLSSA